MPIVIPYPQALSHLTSLGFQSLYHNSGAFSPPPPTSFLGFTGPPDPTLKPSVLPHILPISPPYPSTLSTLAITTWTTLFPGPAWLLPMSHWSFELDFGSHDYLPPLLHQIGINPSLLSPLTTGNPLEFSSAESPSLHLLLTNLFTHLKLSDFSLLFPPHPLTCTIHHHQQLWFTTTNPSLIPLLRSIGNTPPPADSPETP